MLPSNQFTESCQHADDYPKNLIKPETQSYNLEGYYERLNACDDELFSPEAGELIIWEYDDEEQEFRLEWVDGAEELMRKLRGVSDFGCQDPRCRFIFVLAAHSRAPLDTSRKMLMYAFTYHQVMPAFLDFLFPFGQQIYPHDFFFSGFRNENWLSRTNAGPNLPGLGRSGREFRMCYSLKSVEKVNDEGLDEGQKTWSVRQTATYHSFDVDTGVALWISVKGNDEIQERIMSRREMLVPDEKPFSTKNGAFQESLAVHLINCKWAGEEWRWYLNFLEEELQGNTRRIISTKVVRGRKPEEEEELRLLKSRERTMSTKLANGHSGNTPSGHLQPPAATLQAPAERVRSISRGSRVDSVGQTQFNFGDLQHVQWLEDKANEAILVLRTNIEVLKELIEHYEVLTASEEYKNDFNDTHRSGVERFQRQITIIIRNLQIQISRAGTLVGTLANRKALLYGILNHQSTVANISLASKAQQSANNMEKMTRNMEILTREMNELAKKTTKETVSMRIITGVTLFFLPGTFFSTIMSTDIVRFQGDSGGPGPKVFQQDALCLWLYVSIPLMVVTFAAWGIIYNIEKHQAARQKIKAEAEDDEKAGRV